jgi:anhydro-N-acetylmuramic acid kinase
MDALTIGLMSGTSVDAVDGALVHFACGRPATLAFESLPMPPALRLELLALQSPGPDELERAARARLALTDLYAEVALRLLAAGRPAAGGGAMRVQAAGAHGQTVRHRPEAGYTLQLLDGARLAERCGLPVVCDFRSADVAAGGQGAPLVPAFHAHAFSDPRRRRAIVNIGGIANVSLLAPGAPPTGYDTGPGNVLLDTWCEARTGAAFDRDGAWGATGCVSEALLARLLAEPYFGRPAPKSTGRDLFNARWLEAALADSGAGVAAQDVQATIAELTAASVARACREFGADEVYVCGGGAANRLLMRRLSTLCTPATVDSTDAIGAPAQAVEAVAFAWLAARRLLGLPGNLPGVTGASGPRVLGALYPAPP